MSNIIFAIASYDGYINSNVKANDIVLSTNSNAIRFMSSNNNVLSVLSNNNVEIQGNLNITNPATGCNIIISANSNNTVTFSGSAEYYPSASTTTSGVVLLTNSYSTSGASNLVPTSYALSNMYATVSNQYASAKSQWTPCNINLYYQSNVAIGSSGPNPYALNVVGSFYATSYCNLSVASQWNASSNTVWYGSNVSIGTSTACNTYMLFVNSNITAASYCNAPQSQWKGTSNIYYTSNVVIGTTSNATTAPYMLYVNGSVYASSYCNVAKWASLSSSNIAYESNVTFGVVADASTMPYAAYVGGSIYATTYCNVVTGQWTGTSNNIWYGSNVLVGSYDNTTSSNYTLSVNGSLYATSYCNVNITLSNPWFGTSNIYYSSNAVIGTSCNNTTSNYTLYVNGSIYATTYCNLIEKVISSGSTSNVPSTSSAYYIQNMVTTVSNYISISACNYPGFYDIELGYDHWGSNANSGYLRVDDRISKTVYPLGYPITSATLPVTIGGIAYSIVGLVASSTSQSMNIGNARYVNYAFDNNPVTGWSCWNNNNVQDGTQADMYSTLTGYYNYLGGKDTAWNTGYYAVNVTSNVSNHGYALSNDGTFVAQSPWSTMTWNNAIPGEYIQVQLNQSVVVKRFVLRSTCSQYMVVAGSNGTNWTMIHTQIDNNRSLYYMNTIAPEYVQVNNNGPMTPYSYYRLIVLRTQTPNNINYTKNANVNEWTLYMDVPQTTFTYNLPSFPGFNSTAYEYPITKAPANTSSSGNPPTTSWSGAEGTYVASCSSAYDVNNNGPGTVFVDAYNYGNYGGYDGWASNYGYTNSLPQNTYNNLDAGEYIQLQLPTPVYMTSFSLVRNLPYNVFGDQKVTNGATPVQFSLYASTDGTNWTKIYQQQNDISWTVLSNIVINDAYNDPRKTQKFYPSVPGMFQYFRLVITKLWGTDNLARLSRFKIQTDNSLGSSRIIPSSLTVYNTLKQVNMYATGGQINITYNVPGNSVYTYNFIAGSFKFNTGASLPASNTTALVIPFPGVWKINVGCWDFSGGVNLSQGLCVTFNILKNGSTSMASKGYYGAGNHNFEGFEYFDGSTDSISITCNNTTPNNYTFFYNCMVTLARVG